MANIKSQIKRNKQNEIRREKNVEEKSRVRTATRKLNKALENKEQKDVASIADLYKKYVKIVDTAAKKGILHKNTVARKKSRLAKKVNAVAK